MSPRDTLPAHEAQRWLVAPLVAAILRAVAADRGAREHDLSAELCSAVESACLAWLAERERDADKTPVRDLFVDAEHPSSRPTAPAPPLPRGVKR